MKCAALFLPAWLMMITAAFPASHGRAQPVEANVRTGCGAAPAIGNGVTDDSAAFAACMNAAKTASAAGTPQIVRVPAGVYLIKGTQLPVNTYAMKIVGDGPHRTYLKIDPAYSGDVLAWSDAWVDGTYGGPSLSSDNAGPSVEELSIIGNTSTSNIQNAMVFYDHDDFAYVRNVSVYFLNGACVKTGYTKNDPTAYVRESDFYNVKCWHTGTATQPAADISSFTANGSDATNELKFFGLDIFASAGIGLKISNPNAFSATRLIEFHSLRVEKSGADNIEIGAAGDGGVTAGIRIYGLQSINAASGFYSLNIGLGSMNDYDIQVMGAEIGPCSGCYGLRIDHANLVKIVLGTITTTNANITYTSNVGADVVLDASGLEASFTYSVPGTVTAPAWNTFTP